MSCIKIRSMIFFEILIFWVLLFILFSVDIRAENVFYNPLIEGTPSVGTQLNISILSNLEMQNTKLYYKIPYTFDWESVPVSDNKFIIPSQEIDRQGIYEYYFYDDILDSRLPHSGTFKLFINSPNAYYLDAYNGFSSNDSSTSSVCQPLSGSYNCKWEHWQAQQIMRFARQYQLTHDNNFLNIMNNLLSNSSLGNISVSSCDFSIGSFSCGDHTDFSFPPYTYFSGVTRQAVIIASLWNAYSYTNDSLIYELAMNYTMSSPKTGCDVWAENYLCNNTNEQGLMIDAYALAYKNTANETFLNITKNLIDDSDTTADKSLVNGLLRVFELTGNSTYIDNVPSMISDIINDCIDQSCNVMDYSEQSNMLYNAYISFNDYTYERVLFDTLSHGNSGQCAYNDSKSCLTPNEQYAMAMLYELLTYNTKNVTYHFYNPRVLSIDNDNIQFSVKFDGEVFTPRIYYKDSISENFSNFTVSSDGILNISRNFSTNSLIIAYYFDDDNNNRYPSNGSFFLSIPIKNYDLDSKLNSSIYSDPERYCQPMNADPQFSCRFEYMHGKYLEALSYAYLQNNSLPLSSIIMNMSFANIDVSGNMPDGSDDLWSTCDPYDNQFNCTRKRSVWIDNEFQEPGVLRASRLINGYTNAYHTTGNETLKDYALNFAYQHFDECDYWEDEFNCSGSQGEIIGALARLYLISNDNKIKGVLDGLIDFSISNDVDKTAINGLLNAYEISSSDIIDDAQLRTYIITGLDNMSECVESDCSVMELYSDIDSVWTAYKIFNNITYFDLGSQLLLSSPEYELGVCDLNSFNIDTSCINPEEQGMLIQSLQTAVNNYVIREPPNLTIVMIDEFNGSFNNEYSFLCNITNIGEFNILESYRVNIVTTRMEITDITTSPSYTGNYSDDMGFVDINNLNVNSSVLINITVNLTRGGPQQLTCQIINFENATDIYVYDIGEILDFNVTSDIYLNEFNNYSISLNVSNPLDFDLFNVLLSIENNGGSYSVYLNNTDFRNYTYNETSNTIFMPQMLQYESGLMIFIYSNPIIDDQALSLNITANSSYDGTHDYNQEVYYVINNISYEMDINESALITGVYNLSINITNDKPFTLYNIDIIIEGLSNSTIINSYIDQSDIGNSSLISVNISVNESKLLTYEVYFNENSTNPSKPISFNISGNQGINLSTETSYINISNNIIVIDAEDVTINTLANKTINLSITNIAETSQHNITLIFTYDNNTINFIDADLDSINSESSYGEIINLSMNNINLGQDSVDNISVNDANYLNITISNETPTQVLKIYMNITNLSNSYSADMIVSTLFSISYSNDSNVSELYSLKIYSTNISEAIIYPECNLSANTTVNASVCNISIVYYDDFYLLLNFSYLNSSDPQLDNTNITLNLNNINLSVYYNYTISLGSKNIPRNNITLYNLSSNSTLLIPITLHSGSSTESAIFEINASTDLNGIGYHQFTIEKNYSSDRSNNRRSGGGGGGSVYVPSSISNIQNWGIYPKISEFLNQANNDYMLSEYFKKKHEIWPLFNFSELQKKLECLDINKTLEKVKNTTDVNIKIINNCDLVLHDIYLYEKMPSDSVVSITNGEYEIFGHNYLFHISEINYNITKTISYYIMSNESLDQLSLKYGPSNTLMYIDYVDEIKNDIKKESNTTSTENSFVEGINKLGTISDYISEKFSEIKKILFPIDEASNLLRLKILYILIILAILIFVFTNYKVRRQIQILRNNILRDAYIMEGKTDLKKHKYVSNPFEDAIYEINLKINYIKVLVKEKNLSDAIDEYKNVVNEFTKLRSIKTNQDLKKTKYIYTNIQVAYQSIQQLITESNNKPIVKPGVDLSEGDEDKPEYDMFLKMIEIESFIKKSKIKDAEESVHELEKMMKKLNPKEKQKEINFLNSRLEKIRSDLRNGKSRGLKSLLEKLEKKINLRK